MIISGPDTYKLVFDPKSFRIRCAQGTENFSSQANSKKPKLYVACSEGTPIYVGITKQRMRARLQMGWKADGKTGYYGYRWRHHLTEADLHVWYQESGAEGLTEIETVEAELVFLIRQNGQWPPFQTEIHFHPSNEIHRQIALDIFRYFGPG